MGAVVILSSDVGAVAERRIVEIFSQRGYHSPTRTTVGKRVVLLWRKRLTQTSNTSSDRLGTTVFVAGTAVYRGLGAQAGLRRMLTDAGAHSFDQSELTGSYCVLIARRNSLQIFTDPANMYHLYATTDGSVVSSSLEAVIAACDPAPVVNRLALLEQLITGLITPPTTPYEGIKLLDQCEQRKARWPGIVFRAPPAAEDPEPWANTRSECVDHQLAVLRDHFRNIRAIGGEVGVAIGLSGGYDSRLVLGLAHEAGFPVTGYTWSSAAHSREAAIARELARVTRTPIQAVPVHLWQDLDSTQVEANAGDVLGYWDGRSNDTQGSFNDVHTARIRAQALGGAGLGLSGHGGELYRNREHLPPWPFSALSWLRYFVLTRVGCDAILGKASRSSFESYLMDKYGRAAGTSCTRQMTRHDARRWYARVWLPYGAGAKLSAENQLSHALIAFAEDRVIREALRCTPVIGLDGGFQAELISRQNPRLAAVESLYGYPFTEIPLRSYAKAVAYATTPHWFRLTAGGTRARLANRVRTCLPARVVPASGSEDPWRLIEPLRGLGLPVNWACLLESRVHLDRAAYLATFLRKVGVA